jgi:hypothetical protein
VAPPAQGESRLSGVARETVELHGLDRGRYRIEVRRKSENFRPADRFRVLIQADRPETLRFEGQTPGAEIFPPADHRLAITVGEATPQSSSGRTADGRIKPDLVIPDASVNFSSGTTARGSSTAAALFAGVAAVLKGERRSIDAAMLLTYAHALRAPGPWAGAGGGDLTPIIQESVPEAARALVPPGASVLRHLNGHLVVILDQDPLLLPQFLAGGAYRPRVDDLLALNPDTRAWIAVPRASASYLLAPWVEFRQAHAFAANWSTPEPASLESWN